MVSAPIHAFLEFFHPVLCSVFFPSQWLLFQITIVETMDSGERGMNSVAVTINNPGIPGSAKVLSKESSERILA